MEPTNFEKPFSSEEESNFEIMEWISHFFHYWYLFIIGIILSLGIAYLENRSVLPTYQTSGTVMIEENRSVAGAPGTQALMQGFGVESGYKNVQNQLIMLNSYDLVSKVVDSIPFLKVEYISKGNFKTRNLYKTSPIIIQADYVSPEAYNLLFNIKIRPNKTFTITVEDNKQLNKFKIDGVLGVPIQHNMFFVNVNTFDKNIENIDMYFRLCTHESLVSDFSSRLTFGFVGEGSSVLQISLVSDTPDRDIDFINKLCETFLTDNLERKNDAANKTIKFINERLGIVSKSLTAAESEMTNFRQSNKFVDVSSHTSELLAKASKYDTQQSELKLREEYLDYLTKYLKTNMKDGAVMAPSSFGLTDPLLVSSVQQINDLYDKRSETTDKNPYYARYTQQIEVAKLSVLEVVKNMHVALDIEKNDFNKRLALVNKEIELLPEKEIEQVAIDRNYKMADNYYTFFLQKRAESEILKASNSPDNNILDKARIISQTNSDKKKKTTLMFLLFGLLIPSAFVIIKELLNGTIRSSKEIERNSSFPLIGTVKHTNSTETLLVSKNPRSAFTEMFRVIRTRIEFIVKRKTNISVLVTSTESGDGKTYFSINLASVYSMASKKTLLVDMDIRKPSINTRFNMVQPNGVTNYLVGQCTLDEVIFKLPKVDFDILPAGSIPPNPGELIRTEKLNQMFDELRKRYDFIIIDSSPIGMVTDAYSLAHHMDVTLFVVRNNKTNKTFFKNLCVQLKQDKLMNIYTVLNDVMDDGRGYYRYGKYGYGKYGYGSRSKKGKADNYLHYYEDDSEI